MIRKAKISEAPIIKEFINKFAADGLLLPLSLQEIYEHLRDYFVYIDNATICGVCALNIIWDDLAEIRSLAVLENYQNRQIGRQLVDKCLTEASLLEINSVFCLTYKKEFFIKLGFHIIEKSKLPHKVWSTCYKCPKFPDCNEIALIIYNDKNK